MARLVQYSKLKFALHLANRQLGVETVHAGQ